MSADLEQFYRRYVDAANNRDYDAIAAMVDSTVRLNGTPSTPEAVVNAFVSFAEAAPDFTWSIEDLFVVDDRIAARLRDTGTPVKTWLGLEPTGRAIDITEFAAYRVINGRFVEMWFLMDTATAARQLQA